MFRDSRWAGKPRASAGSRRSSIGVSWPLRGGRCSRPSTPIRRSLTGSCGAPAGPRPTARCSAPIWIRRGGGLSATFTGDVADRAEEREASLGPEGTIQRVRHRLPQGRPGAALTESEARALARDAVRAGLGIDLASVREVSANSNRLPARTDWTFAFEDTANRVLSEGEPRIAVEIAGDTVVDLRRFVHVPEMWERADRGTQTSLQILRFVRAFAVAVVLTAGAVFALIRWSRARFPARLAVGVGAALFVALIIGVANNWEFVQSASRPRNPGRSSRPRCW